MIGVPSRRFAGIVLVSLLSAYLGLAACAGSRASSGSVAAGCDAYARYGHLQGRTISLDTESVTPGDEQLIDSLKPFERCTGALVKSQNVVYLAEQVLAMATSGNPPDLVVVPQPGLIRQLVATGRVKNAPESVAANLARFWSPEWASYVTVDGKVYGAPFAASVKSLVWYSPKEFKAESYVVPTTLGQLRALSDKIAAHHKPWCEGVELGDESGWPLTDWMEDMMLRLAGPQDYDKWVLHQIPFDSPGPRAALDQVGAFLKSDKYVNAGFGDVRSILRTNILDAGQPVLAGTCSLHRAASFYSGLWPAGTRVAPDGDVFAFYLPAKDPSSQPVLVAGEFTLAFSDRPEVQALQTYLSSDTWANNMAAAAAGDWISANRGLNADRLTPIDRMAVRLLQDPRSVIRFDGSDQMPPEIGANVFWRQAMDWIGGQSTEVTLRNIDRAWPRS